MSEVTALETFVCAKLVRLEMWKVTKTYVPFSRTICVGEMEKVDQRI